MEYNLEISIGAAEDIQAAIDYYDSVNPLLGDRFLDELYSTLDKKSLNPKHYSLISSDPLDMFRDVRLISFPYVVIYEGAGKYVYVTAVMHTSRNRPLGR